MPFSGESLPALNRGARANTWRNFINKKKIEKGGEIPGKKNFTFTKYRNGKNENLHYDSGVLDFLVEFWNEIKATFRACSVAGDGGEVELELAGIAVERGVCGS